MIARYWSARAPARNLPAYLDHFRQNVVPELKAVSGFVRAELLTRELTGAELELVVLSIWQSLESIDAFANPDRDAAVVAPAATALFTSYDRRVRHYEILSSV